MLLRRTKAHKAAKNQELECFYTICIYINFEGQNNKFIYINNNNLPPSLAKFSIGDRKQGINKCWPSMAIVVIIINGRGLGIDTLHRH